MGRESTLTVCEEGWSKDCYTSIPVVVVGVGAVFVLAKERYHLPGVRYCSAGFPRHVQQPF